jgi:heat shock protein HslJ
VIRKLLLISLVVSAGCSEGTPTAPTATSLEGVWRIISIQPASQALQTAPAGARYQVGFEGERAFVRVDCNTCTGAFTLNASALTIGPALACTRAGCATASYESAVVALLGGTHQIATASQGLSLSSNRGTVLLQR